jgi:hypothetical protein
MGPNQGRYCIQSDEIKQCMLIFAGLLNALMPSLPELSGFF